MSADLQYSLFIVLAPLASLSAAGMLLYAWVNRDPATKIVRTLSWLIIALVGWLAFNTLELVAPSPALTLLFAHVTYVFIVAAPMAWLAFALHYTGQYRWLRWQRFMWLLVIPVINVLGNWTNSWHGFHWSRYEFLQKGNLLAMYVVEYGPFFWLTVSYGYLMIMTGVFLIARRHFTTASIYRGQSRWMLVGAMLPVLSNLVYIFRLFPGLTKDYTVISFAAASMAFAVGISRHDLFRLSPVARELVVDNMSDPMVVVDVNLRIADLNSAARNLLTLTHGDRVRVGQHLKRLAQPWAVLAQRVQTPQHANDNDLEVVGDDRTRTFDVRVTPIHDRSSNDIGHLIVLRDITERKQSERTLRSYASELEAQNKELDAFARTVAHDLKTPLVGLVGFSQAVLDLSEELSEQEIDDLLREINKAGIRMSNIVDALLLLSSVRRKEEVDLSALDMLAIVEEVMHRFSHRIGEMGVHVELMSTETADWPLAKGYAPWVEELWVNYVGNALKYGIADQSGQPQRILLGYDMISSGQMGDPAPAVARFWVRDWGQGVPEDHQATLFTEFTRLAHAGTQGHGLGLSIVRRIADRLDGEVGVDSEPGQGSTFWFTLPLADPPVPESATAATPSQESPDRSAPDIG